MTKTQNALLQLFSYCLRKNATRSLPQLRLKFTRNCLAANWWRTTAEGRSSFTRRYMYTNLRFDGAVGGEGWSLVFGWNVLLGYGHVGGRVSFCSTRHSGQQRNAQKNWSCWHILSRHGIRFAKSLNSDQCSPGWQRNRRLCWTMHSHSVLQFMLLSLAQPDALRFYLAGCLQDAHSLVAIVQLPCMLETRSEQHPRCTQCSAILSVLQQALIKGSQTPHDACAQCTGFFACIRLLASCTTRSDFSC